MKPNLTAELEEKNQRGDLVATVVWNWLQEQKRIQFVPWVTDPESSRYDSQKAAEQKVRDGLLKKLEELILDTCGSISPPLNSQCLATFHRSHP